MYLYLTGPPVEMNFSQKLYILQQVTKNKYFING